MSTFREACLAELARLEHEAAGLRAYLKLTAGPSAQRVGAATRLLDMPDLGPDPMTPRPEPRSRAIDEAMQVIADYTAALKQQPAQRIAEPTVLSPQHLAQVARRGAVPLSPEEEHAASQARLDAMLKGVPVRATGALVSDPSTGSVIRTP